MFSSKFGLKNLMNAVANGQCAPRILTIGRENCYINSRLSKNIQEYPKSCRTTSNALLLNPSLGMLVGEAGILKLSPKVCMEYKIITLC